MATEDSTSANSHFEGRLLKEIESLEEQIKDLLDEQRALKRQLLKARTLDPNSSVTLRKDSLDRAMVEKHVLDILRSADRPVKTSSLIHETSKLITGIKPSTFRTYLHRMKEKGLVVNPSFGQWEIH